MSTNGEVTTRARKVPRDPENDYTKGAAATRRASVEERTRARLEHVSNYSFDPALAHDLYGRNRK